MSKAIHLEKLSSYFKKLNISPTKPSLELVQTLQKRHLETFSFNNIAVLLGKDISLELEDILEKIVTKNLGGYCFEHNSLMYEVLQALGFKVRILIAKVLNNEEKDMPRTHRVTLLEWEDKHYLVDVGFGAVCPQTILNIHQKEEQNGYRVVALANGHYQLELLKDDGSFVLYRFDLAHYGQADCTMGNFYSSKHPNAVFVNNFVIALRKKEVTLSFRNGVYHRITKEVTHIEQIETLEALVSMMREEFGIVLEEGACERLMGNAPRYPSYGLVKTV